MMLSDREPLFYREPREKNFCEVFILSIPAVAYSVWCIAATAYTALIYTHVHNILKNVTIHIET
jgi:hypothetical protein